MVNEICDSRMRTIGTLLTRANRLRGRIRRAVKLLWKNPRFFLTKARLKARLALPPPRGRIVKPINTVNFEFDFALLPCMKLMYRGAFEPETVATMHRILRGGDVFIDVGASVGYLSAVALGIVGAEGEVHSFEPAPEYWERLKSIADLNPKHRFVANRVAVGETDQTVTLHLADRSKISGGRNTVIAGLGGSHNYDRAVDVEAIRLDSYLLARPSLKVNLIKIDVEGTELFVLRGLENYLADVRRRPPIICEILPAAYPLVDADISEPWRYLERFGYHAFDMVDQRSRIFPDDLDPLAATNVLFVADHH